MSRAEYEIVGELGRGGMGWVFLARDRRLDRLAALKVLPPLAALRPASVERFRREAETAARLQHPNIVTVYGVGGDAETPYFAMAYVEGETLAGRLEREGPLPVGEALRIAREVAGALSYAHRLGVIHRDIKPGNVLLEKGTGRALVTDFGVSRLAGERRDRLTATGAAIGTPGYMAPEQARGVLDLDARADIYALGVMTYEMLTGKPPPRGRSGRQRAAVRRAGARLRPDLPRGLFEAIARALEPHRDERYPAAGEFGTELASWAGWGPVEARAEQRLRRLVRGAVAVVVIAMLVAGGWLLRRAGVGVRAGRVADGATIAVMPFAGETPSRPLSFHDMVAWHLRKLPELRVADERVFDPRALRDPTDPDVRRLAERAGARWILSGVIAPAAGDSIRVEAVLVSTAAGSFDETAQVMARSGSEFEVARALAAALARSPTIRSATGPAALTGGAAAEPAGSFDALLAWRTAQNAFRRGDYGTAARQYDRVLALDSTFLIARYMEFLATLMEEPTEARLREAVAVVRSVARRLAPPERDLLAAYLVLFDEGDVARALDRLKRLVAAHPAFLDAWLALGEVQFHFGALAGEPVEPAIAAFERVLELWPGAAPALAHLASLRQFQGERRAVEELTSRYLAVDSTSPIAGVITLSDSLLGGSPVQQARLVGRLRTQDAQVLRIGAVQIATVGSGRSEYEFSLRALEALTLTSRPEIVRREAARLLPALLLAEGRGRDAAVSAAQQLRLLPGEADLERWPAVAYLLGFPALAPARRAVTERQRRNAADPEERAVDLWLMGEVAAAAGDVVQAIVARTALGGLAAAAPDSALTVRSLRAAMEARLAELDGNAAAATEQYQRALRLLNLNRAPFHLLYSGWLPRFRLARLRLAAGDTAETLRLLAAQDFLAAYVDQVLRGPAWLLVGRIALARGDSAEARRRFARVADVLRDAEPPFSAVRDSAAALLAALRRAGFTVVPGPSPAGAGLPLPAPGR